MNDIDIYPEPKSEQIVEKFAPAASSLSRVTKFKFSANRSM